MASEMTLREVCETLNVSRRAVQGYEKAGLVKATGKNKYGYLLYNREAQMKIAQIKFYQKMGFKLKEINILMNASKEEAIQMLKKQKNHLTEERRGIERLIRQVDQFIKQL